MLPATTIAECIRPIDFLLFLTRGWGLSEHEVITRFSATATLLAHARAHVRQDTTITVPESRGLFPHRIIIVLFVPSSGAPLFLLSLLSWLLLLPAFVPLPCRTGPQGLCAAVSSRSSPYPGIFPIAAAAAQHFTELVPVSYR